MYIDYQIAFAEDIEQYYQMLWRNQMAAKEILITQWLSCNECKNCFVESYGCQLVFKIPTLFFKKMDGDIMNLFSKSIDKLILLINSVDLFQKL